MSKIRTPATDHPRPVQVRLRPIVNVLAWGLTALIVFEFFDAIKLLLLGILAACAMASLLRPLVQKIPGPRGLAAVLVAGGAILLTAAILGSVGMLIAKPFQNEFQHWPQTKDQLNNQIQNWSARFGVQQPPTVDTFLNDAIAWISGSGTKIVSGTAAIVVDLLMALGFVFVGSMYILTEPPGRLVNPALHLLSPRHRQKMRGVLNDLEPRLRAWTFGSIIGMVAVGIASGVGYKLVGLNLAIPLALYAGLAEIVPTVGPISAWILGLILATLQGPQQIIGVTIVYVIVQGIESYAILPLIMRRAVNVPPIVTLFTLVLWGKIFGVAGLLLAIPIDLVIWSLLAHFMMHPQED
jgi:predicted PurR-regulated permease PerM